MERDKVSFVDVWHGLLVVLVWLSSVFGLWRQEWHYGLLLDDEGTEGLVLFGYSIEDVECV